jgi:hypothetical protein
VARKGAQPWSGTTTRRLRGELDNSGRLQGGLDDGTGSGEVDDGMGSKEFLAGNFGSLTA